MNDYTWAVALGIGIPVLLLPLGIGMYFLQSWIYDKMFPDG